MFTALLCDQVQEATSKIFQRLLIKLKRKLYLWDRFRSLFTTIFFDSWEQLYLLAENEGGQYNMALRFAIIGNLVNHDPPTK